MYIVALIVLSVVSCVFGHSWIACTDYAEKDAAYWDPNNCRGFARKGHHYTPKDDFGVDKGYNHQANEDQPCKVQRNDEANYNDEYPMAVYYPGQQVILAHPMKNHGADTCTNIYIPDHGNNLYMALEDSTGDVSLSEFKSLPVAHLGTSPTGQSHSAAYPRPGYQNAPAFCENTDRALGTYSFNVPTSLTPGVYTFLWTWAFNSENDLYSSCFEIKIAPKPQRDDELRTKGYPTNVICGGTTSDFSVQGSSIGCDEVVLPVTTTGSPPITATSTPVITNPQTTTTTTTRLTVGPGKLLSVYMRQLAGSIALPPADKSISKRVISVHFDCPVNADFWPVSSVTKHNHEGENRRRRKRHLAEATHHDITLLGRTKARQARIYFLAAFSKDCNIGLYPPIAKLVSEE